jgi:hypothetical protein
LERDAAEVEEEAEAVEDVVAVASVTMAREPGCP